MGLVFLFLVWSCKEDKTPTLPVKEEKMAQVLADIHTAESAIRNATGTDKDSLEQLYYQRIMQIHGISREDYDSTLAIMQKNPEMLIKVYNLASQALDSIGQKLSDEQ